MTDEEDRDGSRTIGESKAMMREVLKAARDGIPREQRKYASALICQLLTEDPRLAPRAGGRRLAIAAYLAHGSEPDLGWFLKKAMERGDRVVVPRWNGENYVLADLKSLDRADLTKGPMGVLQPKAPRGDRTFVAPRDVDVWLVPGLAFDAQGGRIGYGGGWYDRLLLWARPDAPRIGIAFSELYLDELELILEDHDIRMTGLVTDCEIVF